jgi:D-glycero-D-manno-heptose 1,7-bisphosphate phosphatase
MTNTVTIRQCAVLLGGPGADMPTPMLPCGDRPFLAWLLRECVRFGVEEFLLLTGDLPGQVEAAVESILPTLPRRPRVAICRLPDLRKQLDERFLLLNGDTLFDFNLANLLADAALDGPGVIGRMALRVLNDGTTTAGIHVFRRSLLDHVELGSLLERDVLPKLAKAGMLRGTVGEGYFRDIGVPDDFAAAQTEVPRLLHRRALFLDRDGVINRDHHYVGTRDKFEWMPGALAAIRRATQAGWHVFVVTNQSGVARGFYTEADLAALHAWMVDEIRRERGTIDDIRYCPYHPDGAVAAYRRHSDWRKPAPGMLLDLIRVWELDPARCVLIGDQKSDLAAAAAAGVAGHLFTGEDLDAFVADKLGTALIA